MRVEILSFFFSDDRWRRGVKINKNEMNKILNVLLFIWLLIGWYSKWLELSLTLGCLSTIFYMQIKFNNDQFKSIEKNTKEKEKRVVLRDRNKAMNVSKKKDISYVTTCLIILFIIILKQRIWISNNSLMTCGAFHYNWIWEKRT